VGSVAYGDTDGLVGMGYENEQDPSWWKEWSDVFIHAEDTRNTAITFDVGISAVDFHKAR
jgi:hypothetical protein